jgi:hypothetical protein
MSGCGRFEDDEDDEPAVVLPSSAMSKAEEAQANRPRGLGSWSRATVTIGAAADAGNGGAAADGSGSTSSGAASLDRQCHKCQARRARVVVRQNEPLCAECLEAGVVGKVRGATKGRGLLQEGDSVLLALSGGAASAALLYSILELQNGNPERPERGKVSFTLRMAHVSPVAAAAAAVCSREPAAAAAEAAAAIAAAAGAADRFSVLPLELVYEDRAGADRRWLLLEGHGGEAASSSTLEQQQRLQALLTAVGEPTAIEDLAAHLRMQLLRRAAAAAGCNKLLLGDCASTIAARVVSDAAKGRGFSLPADIQSLDARWQAAVQQQPGDSSSSSAAGAAAGASSGGGDDGKGARRSRGLVALLPLREVSMKEAWALADFKGLLPPPAPQTSSSAAAASAVAGGVADVESTGSRKGAASGHHQGNVNDLAHGFVEAMQANLPASIFTVLRTASHLKAFDFNAPAAAGPAAAAAAAVAAGARVAGSRVVGGVDGVAPAAAAAANAAADGIERLTVANGGGSAAAASFCRVCMAPLPPPVASPAAETPVTGPQAAATIAAEHGLCYGCDRYVLRQVAAREGIEVKAARERLEDLLPPKIW